MSTSPASRPRYTLGEEIANSVTHGLGVILSIVGLVVLIMDAMATGSTRHVVSVVIFGSSLILLYLASTLYHSLPAPAAKRVFKLLDHSAIFLLIAGTYTPFTLIVLPPAWGWSIFGIIWSLAFLGILFKLAWISRFPKVSLIIYITMGWLCVVAIHQIVANLSGTSLSLLIAGGLSYTVGTIFYAWRSLPYSHAIWHLFVLGGSIAHFFSVLTAA